MCCGGAGIGRAARQRRGAHPPRAVPTLAPPAGRGLPAPAARRLAGPALLGAAPQPAAQELPHRLPQPQHDPDETKRPLRGPTTRRAGVDRGLAALQLAMAQVGSEERDDACRCSMDVHRRAAACAAKIGCRGPTKGRQRRLRHSHMTCRGGGWPPHARMSVDCVARASRAAVLCVVLSCLPDGIMHSMMLCCWATAGRCSRPS